MLMKDGAIKDIASTVVEVGNNKSPFLLNVMPSFLLVWLSTWDMVSP